MNDDLDRGVDRALLAVRADTRGFSRDVSAMKVMLETGLGGGAERAGKALESALARAVRTGKLGFGDLKDAALGALASIAQSALQVGIGALFGGKTASNPLIGLFGGGAAPGSILSLLGGGGFGPRADGGSVSPGRAFLVGERGPELFVPGATGRIMPGGNTGSAPRDVRVSITVHAPAGGTASALGRSGRQIAMAVKNALADREG